MATGTEWRAGLINFQADEPGSFFEIDSADGCETACLGARAALRLSGRIVPAIVYCLARETGKLVSWRRSPI